jgi:putative membrane protein
MKDSLDINKNSGEKENFIGMRVVKTVISVFISVIITTVMGGMPINSAVASVLTTQDTQDGSIKYGKNRILGTTVGAIFAIIFVFVVDFFDIKLFTVSYYFVMSILIIPIAKILLISKQKAAISSALITFLITLMSYISQSELKYIYVQSRIIDTFIGVLVSIAINIVLPDNRDK